MALRPNVGLPAALLGIVALVSCTHYALGGEVYLSPRGTPVWDGNCNQPTSCFQSSPCAGGNASPTTITGAEECRINFLAGDYAQKRLAFAGDASQKLKIASIRPEDIRLDPHVSNVLLEVQKFEKLDLGEALSMKISIVGSPFFGRTKIEILQIRLGTHCWLCRLRNSLSLRPSQR